MTIDPRLLERRKAVAENKAARNVGRLLRFLGLAAALGLLVWLGFSPWLSVKQVRTAGVTMSDANAVLAKHRVVAGTPLLMLRPGAAEEALLADPWIRDARVHVIWPNEVTVRVIEREPVAWFNTDGEWVRRDVEGIAVPSPPRVDATLPRFEGFFPGGNELARTSLILGVAEFAANLPTDIAGQTELWIREGELWATVPGFEVRLGRPTEMKEKALGLVAMLREEIAPGSTIILVAPTHPAVVPVPTAAEGDEGEGVEEQKVDQP